MRFIAATKFTNVLRYVESSTSPCSFSIWREGRERLERVKWGGKNVDELAYLLLLLCDESRE